ncbi:MAG: hypothetical protein JWR21_982 [Herminiimonas sp.]|nr:hypothetical protein [Herminiimonas sp.]MDB5852364.1 hypothetical protein [Herminiimonas sp.]
MNKRLLTLAAALPLVTTFAFAQSTTSDPLAPKSRADVKAEEKATGAIGTKNIEVPAEPSTKGSAMSRSDAKNELRTSGSSSTGNTEVQGDPSTKGSGLSRSDVKAEERASGSMSTKNIEVQTPTTPTSK